MRKHFVLAEGGHVRINGGAGHKITVPVYNKNPRSSRGDGKIIHSPKELGLIS